MKIEETEEYQRKVEVLNRVSGLRRDLLDLSEELRYFRESLREYQQVSKVEYMQHAVAELVGNTTRLYRLVKAEVTK